jgi:DNA-binding NarL/FixJ family response regulator
MFLNTDTSERPPRVFNSQSKEILLVIDDEPQVRRMLKRFFSHHFDAVITAGTPEEAEAILEQEDVTHIISDYDLCPQYSRGTELIMGWRRQYPSIRRVLLLSGSCLSDADIPLEVDHYSSKGEDPKDWLRVLKS